MLEWARGSARRRMVQMHLRCVLRRARASTLTAVFWRPIGRAWRSFPVVVDAAVKTDAPAERQRRRSPASTEKQERATRATRAQPARASGARPGAPDVEAQLDPHALPLGQAHGPQHLRAPGGASHHVAAYTAPACQPSGWIVCVCVCMHRVTPRTRHSSAAARWRGVRTLSSSQPRPVEPCSAAIPPAAARAPPGVGSGCNRPAATPGRPLRPHRCLPRTK